MLLRTVVLLLLCVSTAMCATIGHFQARQQEEEDTPVDPVAITEGDVAAASVDAAEEAVTPADTQVGDSPAAEEAVTAADTQVGDSPAAEEAVTPADTQVGDSPAAEEAVTPADTQVGDSPAAEEAVNPADTQVGDSPAAEEAVNPADTQVGDSPAAEEAVNPADTQVGDSPAAEEPVTPADTQVGDSPAAEEPAANSIIADNLLAKIVAVDNSAADNPEEDVPVAKGATHEEPETDSDSPAGDAPAVEDVTGEAVTQEQPSSTEAEEDNEIRPVQTNQSLKEAQEDDNSWGFGSIRNSFQTMHGYFESLVELTGGQDGVCQYRCKYGALPQPRPGYQLPEPNGCSTSLVGFQVNAAIDLGIPAMTKCCNQLDVCYDTCGTSKDECDTQFRSCLHGICSDLKSSLGYVSKVQGCESMADAVHGTVGTLGCRPYMNSQRAACVCEGEEKDEL